jgi:DNA topoisomerase-2
MRRYRLSQQNLADELTRQFDRVSNQARFVQMIINKELIVSNKKKADIVTELRALKFKPISKVKIARELGENEPALEEEDEGLAGDYDYLLGMAIWSLTREKAGLILVFQVLDSRANYFYVVSTG